MKLNGSLKINILFVILIFLTLEPSMVLARRDCLQEAKPDALGRSSRPVRDTYAISNSGHFYIHYDTTGNTAPDLSDFDENGVPDFVDEVGTIADSAYYVLVEQMGYNEEPFDGEGGYDIYIMSFGAGVYGFCKKDAPSFNADGQTSWLEIDNDYTGFGSIFNLTPIQIMRISLAHEYFHGIQFGYKGNFDNNQYFYEMSSMWFEDVLIPDGNDYLDGWANPLLNNPTADFDDTGGGYELALFGHYLSSFLDPHGVEDVVNSTIIREIWERFSGTNSSAISAVQYVVNGESYSLTFIEAWTDFISRNLYNGIDESYYYYVDQELANPINTNPQNLGYNMSFTMQLDDESVVIQSYDLGNVDTFYVRHSMNDFIGRIATLSSGNIANNLMWGLNGNSIITDDEMHFIYGSETQDSVVIKLFEVYPYNYSLEDINPNSATYGETISPGFFENQVTLHYFGHQD